MACAAPAQDSVPTGPQAADEATVDEVTADARALLERFVAEVADLSARFEESIFDVDGRLEETSSGQFLLLRPGRFVWHYDSPEEYLVVADGQWLWSYDVEFEQATRQPLSDIASSPAMLLSSEGSLGDEFDVSDYATDDGRRWIELTPRAANADFASARIAFNDGVPDLLELTDGLARLTRIEFAAIDVNSGLDAAAFEFEPPPGVSVGGLDD